MLQRTQTGAKVGLYKHTANMLQGLHLPPPVQRKVTKAKHTHAVPLGLRQGARQMGFVLALLA